MTLRDYVAAVVVGRENLERRKKTAVLETDMRAKAAGVRLSVRDKLKIQEEAMKGTYKKLHDIVEYDRTATLISGNGALGK